MNWPNVLRTELTFMPFNPKVNAEVPVKEAVVPDVAKITGRVGVNPVELSVKAKAGLMPDGAIPVM